MKLRKDNLYSFKVKDRKLEETGFFIAEGKDWILIRHLFADYMVDGYMLLNKVYVENISRDDTIIFTEKVLIANNRQSYPRDIKIPFTTNTLFNWLYNEQIVFQIENKDNNTCWIGKISGSTDKSIFLIPLSPYGKWESSYYTFRKNNIRLISFDSDYINALSKYNETQSL